MSKNGRRLLAGPTLTHDDPGDRAEHRRWAQSAGPGYRHAAHQAARLVKNATITGLHMDTHRGQTVWEADLTSPSGTRHSITIDAHNGTIRTRDTHRQREHQQRPQPGQHGGHGQHGQHGPLGPHGRR